MEQGVQYVVYDKKDKQYLETVYTRQLSHDKSIDDAIKFLDLDIAIAFMKHVQRINKLGDYVVLKREITMEEVE